MTRILKAAIAGVLASFVASAQSSKDNAVVRLDPALDVLVSPDAKVELVKGGFGFTEGPVGLYPPGPLIGCPIVPLAVPVETTGG